MYKSLRMLNWNVAGKRVFVRADLNIHPITTHVVSSVTNTLKFQRLLPTLRWLKEHGARMTLATHIGRPNGYDTAYSTQPLTDYFSQAGFSTVWSTIPDLEKNSIQAADIILLENLRFYAQEEVQNPLFAQQMTHGADFFIEDGFGVLTRHESSVTTAAELFNPEHRSIGLLIQGELEHLQPLRNGPKKPYLVMVGGGKGAEKLDVLSSFFTRATHIALCPGLSELPEAPAFVKEARKAGITVLLPSDYCVYQDKNISIGPETFKAWQPILKTMETIVYNGMMGVQDAPETMVYTEKLFRLFMELPATILIAGGDTTQAAQRWGIEANNIYLSTGGGSTLAYLGGRPLPGLSVID
ncbi:unnamed protein product [Sphagnum balticum]